MYPEELKKIKKGETFICKLDTWESAFNCEFTFTGEFCEENRRDGYDELVFSFYDKINKKDTKISFTFMDIIKTFDCRNKRIDIILEFK